MSVGRFPNPIEADRVDLPLVQAVLDRIIKPAAKLVDEVLEHTAALQEALIEAPGGVLEELSARDAAEVFAKFLRARTAISKVPVAGRRHILLDSELGDGLR